MYYRRRIFSNIWDALLVGVLPLASAVFLAWVVVKSLQTAPGSEKWSLVGIIGAGLVLMLVARFILRSPFFRIPLESAAQGTLNRGQRSPMLARLCRTTAVSGCPGGRVRSQRTAVSRSSASASPTRPTA